MKRGQFVNPRRELLGAGATGQGTLVTGGASGAKGSYVTLGTTSFATGGIIVYNGYGALRYGRLDLAINTGGADVVIVEDMSFYNAASGNSTATHAYFPLRIPAGAVLKARCSANNTGISVATAVMCFGRAPGFVGAGNKVRSLTDWGSGSAALLQLAANNAVLPGVASTFTSWITICASTPADVHRLWFQPDYQADGTRTGGTLNTYEIAIGAAAAETKIATLVVGNAAYNASPVIIQTGRIPAGSRLSCRVANNGAAADTVAGNLLGLSN